MHTRTNTSSGSATTALIFAIAIAMIATLLFPAVADGKNQGGYLTSADPLVVLDSSVPNGGRVIPLINSGDELGDFTFEGIPDGTGLAPNGDQHSVDIYVAHEQSTVPFQGAADHQDSSISKLTVSTKTPNLGAIQSASVVLGPEEGYIRFCSAFMAGPADGFSNFTFFTGEESNDVIPVPAGAAYGPDPSLAPNRQAGYVVAHDTATGENIVIPGMGRLNHENTVPVGGNWPGVAMLTTDDTFSAGTSQLYLYAADSGDAVLADEGALYAFQVTATEAGPVDPADPFNNANDYLDLTPGESWEGRFIEVPREIALGDTGVAPQTALENWSNENNVFQFVRLEDVATDLNDPSIAYVADTGASRITPDPVTGRMWRPAGAPGGANGGSIFKFEFDPNDPLKVDGFSVLAQGDDATMADYVPFQSPDNIDTSKRSLMVQEDTSNAKVWQHNFKTGGWGVVAHVTDPGGESSGIADASKYFGPGWWVLVVQGSTNQMAEIVDGIVIKRGNGQLLLMKIPGS